MKRRRRTGRHGGERVVVRGEREEEEERDEPDAHAEERRDLHERRTGAARDGRVRAVVGCGVAPARVGHRVGEVVEPEEVVRDDEHAGRDERRRLERDEGPQWTQVLQVHEMAQDGERDEAQRQRVECP